MRRPKSPEPRGLAHAAALRQIRENKGLTQGELATLLGLAPGTISDWERGDTTLRRSRLDRVAQSLGVAPQVVDALVEAHLLLHHDAHTELPVPLAHDVVSATWATATAVGRTTRGFLLESALAAQAKADRCAAGQAWAKLKGATDLDRPFLIERVPGVATWALVERVAAESIAEAPDRPDIAMKLARLALRSAELAPVSDLLRGCLIGYAHAHIGNAHRVDGELRPAEAAFATARRFWPEGVAEPAGLLSEARLFDLEASLRRDLREFDKALELIDRALALGGDGPARGRILLNRGFALMEKRDFEGSLEAIRYAIPLLGDHCVGRVRFQALFNLGSTLLELGRFPEAIGLLPEVRDLATSLGRRYDLIRLLWLEARAQEGLGRFEAAALSFDQVRKDFIALDNHFDAALVGLDLAAVYLRAGRNVETRDLARQMAAIFGALGIVREELATVRLFLEATERDTATVELARRAAAALRAVRRARDTDETCG